MGAAGAVGGAGGAVAVGAGANVAVGGIAGAIAGAVEGDKQARKQRRFIERMRSTAYQATMEDMRKAGLNPILAYKTGPTPIGSAAAGVTPDFGQALASGVNSAVKAFKAGSERKLTKAQTAKTRREALLTEFRGRTEADRYNAKIGDAQVANINANTRQTNATATLTEAEIPRAEAIKNMDESQEGQFFIQGQTVIQRATGALRGARSTIKGGR